MPGRPTSFLILLPLLAGTALLGLALLRPAATAPAAAPIRDRMPGLAIESIPEAAAPAELVPVDGTFEALARHRAPEAPRQPSTAVPDVQGSRAPWLAEPFRLSREDVLKERDGVYGYLGKGYRATFDQGWVAVSAGPEFEGLGQGVLGLRLERVEVGGRTLTLGGAVGPRADATTRVVAYDRGDVEERYTLRPGALEQDFVLRKRAGDGDIVVTCAVSTNLEPPAGPARRLSFTRHGREAMTVSEAVAVDAQGRRLDLEMACSDGRLRITVPAAWADRAAWPITIDPLIGGPLTVDTGIRMGWNNPSVAVGDESASGTWLVVWTEPFGAGTENYDVYGQRVSLDGLPEGGPFAVAASAASECSAGVSYAPAPADRWLVVWSHNRDTSIRGTILNGNGTFYRSNFLVGDGPSSDLKPNPVYGAGKWHVSWPSWEGATFSTMTSMRGAFVSTDGLTIQPAHVALNLPSTIDQALAAGFSGGTFGFAWKRGGYTSASVIEARTLNASGAASPIVTVGTPSAGGYVANPSVDGGDAGFLITWTDSPGGARYRLATSAMSFTTTPLTLYSNGEYPRAVWTPQNAEWFIAFRTWGSVLGARMSGTGAVRSVEWLADTGGVTADLAPVAWSPTRNSVAVAYQVLVSSTNTRSVFVQRYSLIDPPTAPTGLKAVASNSKVTVSWTAVAGATSYALRRTSPGQEEVLLDLAGTSFPDTSVDNGRTYTYAVAALNAAGPGPWSASVSATPNAPSSHPVLLVVGNTTLNTGDAAVRTRLLAMGYAVTVKSGTAAVSGDASGKRLVLISSTVDPVSVGTKFRGSTVPVLLWENALFDDMKMTGIVAQTDFGTQATQTNVAIVSPAHPLAAGLSGTSVQVLTASKSLTWGKPGSSAARAASVVGNSGRSVVFGYEKGSAMVGLTAPARRVGFFLDDTAAASLNANGWRLFEAAVRWATGAPPGPTYLNVSAGNGSASLSWAPVAGALSYDVLRSTSLNGTYTTVARGLTDTGFLQTGLTNGTTYYFKVVAVNVGGPGAASPAGSVQPAAKTLVAGIVGPYHIWSLRPGVAFNALLNRGVYDVIVQIKDGTTYTAADATKVTTTPRLMPRRITPPSPAVRVTKWTTLQYHIDAITPDADLTSFNPYDFEITVTYPNYPPVVVTVPIAVSYRFAAQLRFYFPQAQSGPGQTERPYPFTTTPGIPPNKFFLGTTQTDQQGTRNDARSQFLANLVYTRTDPLMRQAGLRLYSSMEETYPLKIQGFNTNGDFVSRDATTGLRTPGLQALIDDANKNPMRIQVYFVKNIVHAGTSPQGLTPQTYGNGVWSGNVVLIGDDDPLLPGGDIAHVVLAHELGHAFGLEPSEHIEFNTDLLGTLNNLQQVVPDWRERLIMRGAISSRQPNIQRWFVDLQAMKMAAVATKHPATKAAPPE